MQRRRTMRHVLGGALLFVIAMGLLAFGNPAEAAKFRIGAHRSIMGSYEVVADKMGYWKKEGLDYRVGHFKQGKLMRNAIIQNDLDVGTTGFSPFSTAISKGAKLVGIGVTANVCKTSGIWVLKNSKIQSINDLRGKSFATKKGTSVDFSFKQYVLPNYNVKENEISWMSVNTTERMSLLLSGTVDAAIVGDPKAEIAKQKGQIRQIENFCRYDKTRLMHVANPRTLKGHSKLYEKYFRGWLKAHTLLRENPKKYAQVYTDALVEVGVKTSVKIMLPVVQRLQTQVFIDDEVRNYLNDMADKQIKLGWIRKHPDFTKSKWLDDSILRKVAKEMNFRQGQN